MQQSTARWQEGLLARSPVLNHVARLTRDEREVMVGHVDADVVRNHVQWAAVGKGFVGVQRFASLLASTLDRGLSSLVGSAK